MPYAVTFSQRVTVFHTTITRDKNEHQGDRVNFLEGRAINIAVRRNFIYEDSFDKLSQENGREIYFVMRLSILNTSGWSG